jgi:hypothetical protein
MRPSYDDFEDLAFDEPAVQRKVRNRELAQMRVNSRNHYSPDDEDEFDDEFDDYDDEFDDYDDDEWDGHSM